MVERFFCKEVAVGSSPTSGSGIGYTRRMQKLQLRLTGEDARLHALYGAPECAGIYGAGCLQEPEIMLMFMNPTARNISSKVTWNGIRAPWLGVRNTWKLLAALGLIDQEQVEKVLDLHPDEWTETVAQGLYEHVAAKKLYISNLASCTQVDARSLPDSVFRAYLPQSHKEILTIKPKKIITLGNQVSSILLQRPISVSRYVSTEYETLSLEGDDFKVYPTYYPVGQGQRNMDKAIARIQAVAKM